MSRQINAEHVKRGDLPSIPPNQIVVDHSENTRLYEPDYSDLVQSFKTDGQLQPCIVRPLPDGRVQLVAGYRRWMAAKCIADEQEHEGVPPEDRFKLAVVVQKMSPTEALDRNIVENHEREALSPIEQAHAIRRLRNAHGWTNGADTIKIAKMFRKSFAWVGETEELLTLPEERQKQVHANFVSKGQEGISRAVGLVLTTIPEDHQEAALIEAELVTMAGKKNDPKAKHSSTDADKKPGKAKIKARVLSSVAEKHGATKLANRTARDLVELVDGYFDGSEALNKLHPITEELLKRIKGFITREADDAKFDGTLLKIDAVLKLYYEQYVAQKRAKK
jgi:ParB/RepB/Spo0J family partition protein